MTRDELRAWLDRKPPPSPFEPRFVVKFWLDWWSDGPMLGVGDMGTYLGIGYSARSRPDLRTAQPCGCEQCRNTATEET